MTRDECIAMMLQVLGFRTGLQSTLVSNLKFAQLRLEQGPTLPWFLISEDSFTSTTALDERLQVPSDFLQEADMAVLKYVPDDGTDEVDLHKDVYDVLRANFKGEANGPPKAYALVGGYFRLFPKPDAVYTIRTIYYQRDLLLDSNIENAWLKNVPNLLMGMAGSVTATSLRDSVAKVEFERWAGEGRILLQNKNISRDMENMDMQIGGPH